MTDEILNQIKHYDTVIIHRHARPDPDALGSQGGLAWLIRDNFPGKSVYCAGSDDEGLAFLAKMDTVEDEAYARALVIVCDSATRERIDDDRYANGKALIKIDHHPPVDAYGDLQWVDTGASSVSEMIARLFCDHHELTMSAAAARLLFAGIVGDTGRFQYSNTTARTFAAASVLVEQPFDRQEFFNSLYHHNLNVLRLNGYVLQHFTLTAEGVGYIKLPLSIIQSFHLDTPAASGLVNCFATVEGLKAWVLFAEEKESIRARLRSKGPAIHELAAVFNGGGHPLASGATVYSWEQADELIDRLRTLVRGCTKTGA
ncbi:MAG: bifunctional oligoribonuclease/PAP phosphatase NrnA [Sporolactobacillus sp.]